MAPARLARLLLMEKGIYIRWCQIVYYLGRERADLKVRTTSAYYYEYGYGWALMPLSRPK